jgi:hypothetical protein
MTESRGSSGVFISSLAAILLFCELFLLPGVAQAHPTVDCINHLWNTEGKDNDHLGFHTGIKSLMAFYDGSNDCLRVSSVAVVSAGGGSVEFGWFLGWDTNGNAYSGSGACQQAYFSSPELFEVWAPDGGAYHCKRLGQETSQNHYVSVYDTDQNSIWAVGEGGSQLDNIMNVNFFEGVGITNGERHNSSDTARAHFQDLQKTWVGHENWSSFCCSTTANFGTDDPGFHWTQGIDDTETYVVPD